MVLSVQSTSSYPRVALRVSFPPVGLNEFETYVRPSGITGVIWNEPNLSTGPRVIVNVTSSPGVTSVLSADIVMVYLPSSAFALVSVYIFPSGPVTVAVYTTCPDESVAEATSAGTSSCSPHFVQVNVAVAVTAARDFTLPVQLHVGSPYSWSHSTMTMLFTKSLTVAPLDELVFVANVPLSQVR